VANTPSVVNGELDMFRWCLNVIEGVGGMNDYERYELAVFPRGERVHAVEWAIKCLANPRCEGSKEMLDAIIERRRELEVAQ
jgi:hypothetical protein